MSIYFRLILITTLVGIVTFRPCNSQTPKVALGSDCPTNGYSLSSEFTCTCNLTDTQSAAVANWFDQSGAKLENVTAIFQAKRDATDTYTCGASVVDDRVHNISYTPRLAYGPVDVYVKTKAKYAFEDRPIELACELPEGKEQPSGTRVFHEVIYINGNNPVNNVPCSLYIVPGRKRRSTGRRLYKCGDWSPSIYGNFLFRCKAQNGQYSKVEVTDERLVKVTKRPEVKITHCGISQQQGTIWIEPQELKGCKCTLTDNGFPEAASAIWEDYNTGKVIKTGAPAEITTYVPSTGEKVKTLECTAKNSEGESVNSSSFTVHFIYGPTALTFEVKTPKNTIELNKKVTIVCFLNRTFVNPDATLEFSVLTPSDTGYTSELDSSDPAYTSLTVIYTPSQKGEVAVHCISSNKKRSHLTKASTETFNIYKRPEVSITNCPILSSQTPIWIEPEEVQSCKCTITDKGFPETTWALWKYGTGNTISGRNSASLSIYTRPMSDNSETFECTASNRIGKTLNPASFTVNFIYGPKTESIGITFDPPSEKIDMNTTKVTINCALKIDSYYPAFTGPEFSIVYPADKGYVYNGTETTSTHLIYTYTYTPYQVGKVTVNCKFSNLKKSSINGDRHTPFMVNKLPEVQIENCEAYSQASTPPQWTYAEKLEACKCKITDIGMPRTRKATWRDTNKVIKTEDKLVSLIYTPVKTDDNKTFECTAENTFGKVKSPPNFTVRLAYGPTGVSATYPSTNLEKNKVMNFIVTITEALVNPGAEFLFKIVSSNTGIYSTKIDNARTDKNGFWQVYTHFEYTPIKIGEHTVKFSVRNTQFHVLLKSQTISFEVDEEPTVDISNCDIAVTALNASTPPWTVMNDLSKCRCDISVQGYPVITKTEWIDGDTNKVISNGPKANIKYTPKNGDRNKTFVCNAKNRKGSSKIKPTFTVQLAHGPTLINLTVLTPDAEIKVGNDVEVNCTIVSGNVNPDANITFEILSPKDTGYTCIDEGGDDNVLFKTYRYTPDNSGEVTAQCKGTNTRIGSIMAVKDETFVVKKLPIVRIESCPPYTQGAEFATVDELSGCKCVLVDKGVPMTNNSIWYDEKLTQLSTNGFLSYTPTQGDKNKTFTCLARNSFGRAMIVYDFLVSLVWGPRKVYIGIDSTVYILGTPLSVRCIVFHWDRNPNSTISFNILYPNDTEYNMNSSLQITTDPPGHALFIDFIPQKGKLITQCRATNSKNDTLFTTNDREFHVIKQPEVRINNCPFYNDTHQVTQWAVADDLSFCECEVNETGYPETNKSVWIDEKQNIIVSQIGKSPLKYILQYGDSSKTFSCVAKNEAGDELFPTNFTVNLAYGPKTVGIRRLTSDDKNVVGSEVEIECSVYTDTVNPTFVAELKITHPEDIGHKHLRNETRKSGSYPYDNVIFGYTPSKTGRVSARCIVTNSKISSITANSNIEFFVKGNSTVKLENCHNPIKGAKEGSCKCVLDDPGNPVSVPAWYDKDDNLLVNGTSSGAVLSVNESQANVTFYCKGSSSYGTSKKVEYKTDFVYGPGDVNIGVDEKRTNWSVAILYCEVFLSQIRPGYQLDLYVVGKGKQTVFELQGGPGDDFRRQVYKFDVANKSGNLTAECVANNSVIPEFMNSAKMTHQIEERPVADITNCPAYDSIKSGAEVWIGVGGPNDPLACNCTLTYAGNPQTTARAQWLDGKTEDLIREGDPVAELNYLRKSGEQSKTFRCQATNPAGVSENTTSFEVKYAYGPDNVTVKIDTKQTTKEKTLFYCESHLNSTRPGLIHGFQILEDNIVYNSSDEKTDPAQGTTRDYFVFPTPKGLKGNFTAECRANNSKDMFLGAVSTMEFTIGELPTAEIINCSIYEDYKPEEERWLEINGQDDRFVCECNVTNPGFPVWSSRAQWVDAKTGELLEEGKSIAKLDYIRRSWEYSRTFKCQARNSAGVSEKTTSFEVNFATGPAIVSIVLDEDNTTREKAMFYCEVETASVKPKWTTTFKMQEVGTKTSFSHQNILGQLTRDYFVFDTANIKNGNFTAECSASNTKINTIEASSKLKYTVEELPSATITKCPVYENRVPGQTIWVQAEKEEPVVCGCDLSNPGFPTYWSRAQWVDESTGEVIQQDKPVAELSYTRSSNENTKTFKCQARNTAGISTEFTSFTVSYYYGPNHLKLTLEETPKFDKDRDTPPASITVFCTVPSNINPSSSVKVVGLNSDGVSVVNANKPDDTKEETDKSIYKFIFPPPLDDNKRPAINMKLKCIAENDVNSSLTVEDEMMLEMPVLELSGCPPLTKGTEYAVEPLKKSANCQCRLKNKGTPKGELRWINAQGAVLSTGKNNVVLNVDTNDHDSTFTCQALTLWSVVEEIPFTPQFKVPPDNPPTIEVTIGDKVTKIKDGDTVEIDTGDWLYVKCNVDGGIPVVSKVTLSYGSQSKTSLTTVLTTNITVDKSLNQVQFKCGAEHETGQYSKATTFKLNVLHPAILESYTINDQNTSSVQVRVGEPVTFVCIAWGNPAPIMAISGQLTKIKLKGQRKRFGLNAYKLIAVIESISVSDTDTYICTALTPPRPVGRKKRCAEEVKKTDQETASDLIVIGPPLPVIPEDNPPVAKSRPSGQLLVEVEVISHPAPVSYVFAKETGREGNTSIYTEIHSDKYTIEFTEINCRLSSVQLWTADYEIDENTRYKFTINNAVGSPSHFYMGTRKEDEPNSEYRVRSETDFRVAIALSAVFSCLLIGVIGMIIAYSYWMLKGKGSWKQHRKTKELREQRQRNRPSTRQNHPGLQSPVQLPPEEQSPAPRRPSQKQQGRLWWQNL